MRGEGDDKVKNVVFRIPGSNMSWVTMDTGDVVQLHRDRIPPKIMDEYLSGISSSRKRVERMLRTGRVKSSWLNEIFAAAVGFCEPGLDLLPSADPGSPTSDNGELCHAKKRVRMSVSDNQQPAATCDDFETVTLARLMEEKDKTQEIWEQKMRDATRYFEEKLADKDAEIENLRDAIRNKQEEHTREMVNIRFVAEEEKQAMEETWSKRLEEVGAQLVAQQEKNESLKASLAAASVSFNPPPSADNPVTNNSSHFSSSSFRSSSKPADSPSSSKQRHTQQPPPKGSPFDYIPQQDRPFIPNEKRLLSFNTKPLSEYWNSLPMVTEGVPAFAYDFYDFINIDKNATSAQIKSACTRILLKIHPDKIVNITDAKEKDKRARICAFMTNLTGILLDESRRKDYNELLVTMRTNGQFYPHAGLCFYSHDMSVSLNRPSEGYIATKKNDPNAESHLRRIMGVPSTSKAHTSFKINTFSSGFASSIPRKGFRPNYF